MNTAKNIMALISKRPGRKTPRNMQKSALSHSLNIARSLKSLHSFELCFKRLESYYYFIRCYPILILAIFRDF